MTDRPIIFSTPMVRALLAGRKTQTRRVAKVPGIMGGRYPILPPEDVIELEGGEFSRGIFHYRSTGALSGPYRLPATVGDRLYVREAWAPNEGTGGGHVYRAEHGAADGVSIYDLKAGGLPTLHVSRWRSSTHMPRWASRLTLIVEGVKVEPLQAITLGDICAEGLAKSIYDFKPVQRGFDVWRELWDTLHTKPGERWEDNPHVVALTFRVVRENIDKVPA